MALIRGYTPTLTPISCKDKGKTHSKFGGWQDTTKTMTPMRFSKLPRRDDLASPEEWALNSITLAVEAGIVDAASWGKQLFASSNDLLAFCDALSDYDLFWVNERHFHAFRELTGFQEDALTTYPDIANALREAYEELTEA